MIHDYLGKSHGILKEDILLTKFFKPSFVDSAGKRFRNKIISKLDVPILLDNDILFEIIKKK